MNLMNIQKTKENQYSQKNFFDSLVLFVLSCFIVSFLLVPSFSYGGVIFHCCAIGVPFFLIKLISKKTILSFVVVNLLVLTIYTVNEYVYAARLSYIRFSDIYAFGDAMRVAGRYSVQFGASVIIHIIVSVVLVIFGVLYVVLINPKLLYRLSKWKIEMDKPVRTPHAARLLPAIFFVLSLSGVIGTGIFGDPGASRFDMEWEYRQNGVILTWLYQYKRSQYSEPEGYSKGEADRMLKFYEKDDGVTVNKADLPNIIVIMNESFTDYSLVGRTSWTEDPLDDIHRNTELKKGILVSSVYGGYTATPEYELLTGMNNAFLPEGRVAYLSFMKESMESLVSDVKSIGYKTTALHQYYGAEFNRITIYNHVYGFDHVIFGEDMGEGKIRENKDVSDLSGSRGDFGPDHDYFRGFISDREGYDTILKELKEGGRHFIFNVSVHNHGGYGIEPNVAKGTVYTGDSEWDDFLNGMARSDDDFNYFLEELKKSDQECVVLMFGDHQPAISAMTRFVDIDPVYKVNGGEMAYYQYLVPYYLWTNSGRISLSAPEITSANYLSLILKEEIGLPLNAWDQLRKTYFEKYPVFTCQYIRTKDGRVEATAASGIKEKMKDYDYIQYDKMHPNG